MGAAEAGHAQPSTTLAIYTQVYDKRRKEIRSQMSKELNEQKRSTKAGTFVLFWWVRQDLNPRPSGYEPPALTN